MMKSRFREGTTLTDDSHHEKGWESVRNHRCLRCQHNVEHHGKHGGWCNKEIYTRQRIDHGGDDGIEIIEDVTICSCPYLMLGA